MKILVLGGTGFIGTHLCTQLAAHGHNLIVLARNPAKARSQFGGEIQIVPWDYTSDTLPDRIHNIDCVVNLAGESIGNRRWSVKVKDEILRSRIAATRTIVNSIRQKLINPSRLINASAIGIYGPHDDEKLYEASPAADNDFLAEVCRKWEEEAYKAQESGVTVTLMRIGVVLGDSAGALQRMIVPFRLFMGGSIGSGKQWLSWIHIQDLVDLFEFVIEREHISGPVNATAPNPTRMKEFSEVLGQVMNRPSWLPMPGFMLRTILGEMADLVLNGQKVLPEKALQAGYAYRFPVLRDALEDLVRK